VLADLIFTVASVIFCVTLIPTIRQQTRDKSSTIPMTTSVLTAGLLAADAFAFAYLGSWLPAVTTLTTGSAWAIIALQRRVYGDPTAKGDNHD